MQLPRQRNFPLTGKRRAGENTTWDAAPKRWKIAATKPHPLAPNLTGGYYLRRGFRMGLLTPNDIKNFQSLYSLQLRYLLSAENQIVKGLKSMISHSTDQQLKQAFQSHLQETEVHVTRLEEMLRDLNDGNVDDKKDPIVTALIGAGDNIVKESDEGPVRDAGLIASAQKVEHYEMASYGSARNWARILGLSRHAEMLQRTLDEEKHADELLTSIAERTNTTAAAAA
jgi:ferritin-like metal-binding protein YciE